eukprot:1147386-Pelagomonas_calceolata.AAC.4
MPVLAAPRALPLHDYVRKDSVALITSCDACNECSQGSAALQWCAQGPHHPDHKLRCLQWMLSGLCCTAMVCSRTSSP